MTLSQVLHDAGVRVFPPRAGLGRTTDVRAVEFDVVAPLDDTAADVNTARRTRPVGIIDRNASVWLLAEGPVADQEVARFVVVADGKPHERQRDVMNVIEAAATDVYGLADSDDPTEVVKGTVNQVLAFVRDHPEHRDAVLEAERAGRARQGIVTALTDPEGE